MTYVVYILRLQDHRGIKYYTGMTNNFDRRLSEHINKRSKYTSKFKVLESAVVESYDTYSEARNAELRIKQYSHAKKEQILESCLVSN